ncbi:LPXTG cell wall anchor domain-containing protein [Streptomyces luteolifulvus]|uniref:LPXTG cell wall anchor domain-containing protein n=1 Tax=Streptomyces luteolifulvus TaxID=2615112 RepID=A0A6H9V3C9_9ACTN|nr:LAETG motif-containing sortase-dependent surface protein [Streptomyces luteolifulvus]KAB1147802.1 LPXTG cell wall anchor domain-containing protein [Streptomyces luteolifulvus]
MSSARRPLLTATAAGTLLGALWFVPSANATQDGPARAESSASPAPQVTTQARAASTVSDGAASEPRLADTGSFDTTPYVVGGTTLLAVGAGFVVYSVRRERLGF